MINEKKNSELELEQEYVFSTLNYWLVANSSSQSRQVC